LWNQLWRAWYEKSQGSFMNEFIKMPLKLKVKDMLLPASEIN
jgi:hypothetical protein